MSPAEIALVWRIGANSDVASCLEFLIKRSFLSKTCAHATRTGRRSSENLAIFAFSSSRAFCMCAAKKSFRVESTAHSISESVGCEEALELSKICTMSFCSWIPSGFLMRCTLLQNWIRDDPVRYYPEYYACSRIKKKWIKQVIHAGAFLAREAALVLSSFYYRRTNSERPALSECGKAFLGGSSRKYIQSAVIPCFREFMTL